jgi:hypothetical protein
MWRNPCQIKQDGIALHNESASERDEREERGKRSALVSPVPPSEKQPAAVD